MGAVGILIIFKIKGFGESLSLIWLDIGASWNILEQNTYYTRFSFTPETGVSFLL